MRLSSLKNINNKLIFLPPNHLPMRTLWCKNQENPSDRISHAWAPLRLRGMKTFFELGQKDILFFFSFMNPLYEPILVFPKFDQLTAPGTALCVDLGPKCQNLFCLV
jgi:hypothetical protein